MSQTQILPPNESPTSSEESSIAQKRTVWQSLKATKPKSKAQQSGEAPNGISRSKSNTSSASRRKPPQWWRILWFRGMYNDIQRRAPYYLSDYTDAWDYRVVPATVYMYFANILPALAFSLDMFDRTNGSYGVNEVLLASVLGSFVFSFFAAQPLTIVGVTGPITIFNYTVYDIMVPKGTNYFAFMCLIGLWSMGMHWFLAMTNSCNGLKYVTRFSCDTFGFYVAFVYLQKGSQVLTRQFDLSSASAYLSITVSLLVLIVAYGCGIVGESTLFQRYVRKFIEDYGTPLTIIFFTGFVHIGRMNGVEVQTLPTSVSFFPTTNRPWLVPFWEITDMGNVGASFGFALVLTILFWFDHNVSSLIAQGTEFPLVKPAGFHWDIFLLGITTGVAGLLGIPFPNGLIPQAPFHTNSLCVTRQVPDEDDPSKTTEVVDHVVEQRVSNLAQGLLTLGTMTGPLLVVLHLIPQAVLAGLFFVMGCQALAGNGITLKILYLCRDRHLSVGDPLRQLERQSMIWLFVGLELFGFGAAFAVTQTTAAIGFPIIILLLIPLRAFVLPLWFTDEELKALDAPTASPFTMESVGGQKGYEDETPLGAGGEGDDTGMMGENEKNAAEGSGRQQDGVDAAEKGQSEMRFKKRGERSGDDA